MLWAILPGHRRTARWEREQFVGPGAAAHFLPLSMLVRDDMRAFYGVPEERLHVVHHGIDAAAFSPENCAPLREQARRSWGLADGTVCFLFVGNAFRRKGVPELLRAAALLRRRRSDFRVLIVGRPERNRFWFGRLRARLAGCADVVEFTGAVVPVQRAYAAADAFVLPSWYDTFGLVLLEAMACGLPVIATRQCGAADLLAEGREGFVVDTPADAAALAERMEQLMDPAVRGPMGQAARRTALEHTSEREFRDLLAVLETAAAERRAGVRCDEPAPGVSPGASGGASPAATRP
jgi:UDP-glucose:(heptosyl)LPS alpha-1,3-glucosyltransferase